MKYIKLFEDFGKGYVEDSIKDILVELKDLGMIIEVWHVTNKKEEYYSISITGKEEEEMYHQSFNTNILKDYVDTVIDFMKEFCHGFEPYFEYYGNNEKDLGESETLLRNKKVAQVVFVFTKRK